MSTEALGHLLVSAIPWCVQIAGLIAFVLLLSPRLDFWYVFDLVLIIETSRLRSEGLGFPTNLAGVLREAAGIYRSDTLDFLCESLWQPRPGEAPCALVSWLVFVPHGDHHAHGGVSGGVCLA